MVIGNLWRVTLIASPSVYIFGHVHMDVSSSSSRRTNKSAEVINNRKATSEGDRDDIYHQKRWGFKTAIDALISIICHRRWHRYRHPGTA